MWKEDGQKKGVWILSKINVTVLQEQSENNGDFALQKETDREINYRRWRASKMKGLEEGKTSG